MMSLGYLKRLLGVIKLANRLLEIFSILSFIIVGIIITSIGRAEAREACRGDVEGDKGCTYPITLRPSDSDTKRHREQLQRRPVVMHHSTTAELAESAGRFADARAVPGSAGF